MNATKHIASAPVICLVWAGKRRMSWSEAAILERLPSYRPLFDVLRYLSRSISLSLSHSLFLSHQQSAGKHVYGCVCVCAFVHIPFETTASDRDSNNRCESEAPDSIR